MTDRCRATCKWTHCTGKGPTTVRWAHRCAIIGGEVEPVPCAVCGQPGRLMLGATLCDDHRPAVPVPDPDRTAAALATRQLTTTSSGRYGTATTDPLDRTGPTNRAGIPTRIEP